MSTTKQKQENAKKIANVLSKLDDRDQQRAVDIVTGFSLGVDHSKKFAVLKKPNLKAG